MQHIALVDEKHTKLVILYGGPTNTCIVFVWIAIVYLRAPSRYCARPEQATQCISYKNGML